MGKKQRVLCSSGPAIIMAYCMLAKLGLNRLILAGLKVSGDELSCDGPLSLCINVTPCHMHFPLFFICVSVVV